MAKNCRNFSSGVEEEEFNFTIEDIDENNLIPSSVGYKDSNDYNEDDSLLFETSGSNYSANGAENVNKNDSKIALEDADGVDAISYDYECRFQNPCDDRGIGRTSCGDFFTNRKLIYLQQIEAENKTNTDAENNEVSVKVETTKSVDETDDRHVSASDNIAEDVEETGVTASDIVESVKYGEETDNFVFGLEKKYVKHATNEINRKENTSDEQGESAVRDSEVDIPSVKTTLFEYFDTEEMDTISVKEMHNMLSKTSQPITAKCETPENMHGNKCALGKKNILGDKDVIGKKNVIDKENVYGDKDVVGKKNVIDKENVYGDKDVVGNKNVLGKKNVLSNKNVLGDKDVIGKKNVLGKENMLNKKNIIGDKDVIGKKNIPGGNAVVGKENVLSKKNVLGNKNLIGDKDVIVKKNVHGNKNVLGNKNILSKANIIGDKFVVGKKNIIDKENVLGVTDVYGKKNVIGKKNTSDNKENVVDPKCMTLPRKINLAAAVQKTALKEANRISVGEVWMPAMVPVTRQYQTAPITMTHKFYKAYTTIPRSPNLLTKMRANAKNKAPVISDEVKKEILPVKRNNVPWRQ